MRQLLEGQEAVWLPDEAYELLMSTRMRAGLASLAHLRKWHCEIGSAGIRQATYHLTAR